MSKYVMLGKWTDQGAHDYTNTLQRVSDDAESFVGTGGEMLDVYWTMGNYDVVMIAEFPDDESAAAAALKVAGASWLRLTTMRALDKDTIGKLVG